MWFCKILIKIVISKLPVSYSVWRKLRLFRHGKMDDASYSQKIFNLHVSRYSSEIDLAGKRVLEVGCGDSVASGVLAFLHGCESCFCIDVGEFATSDLNFYKEIKGSPKYPERWGSLQSVTSFSGLLETCKITYETEGLDSLRRIDTCSIDLSWSHSVLEHVRLKELTNVLAELHRVMVHQGVSSHNIDYQDHLAFSLNNLRFGSTVWELDWLAQSGFYTNRIRAFQMHRKFAEVGFSILFEDFGKWADLPIERRLFSDEFRDISDEELKIRTSSILVKKD